MENIFDIDRRDEYLEVDDWEEEKEERVDLSSLARSVTKNVVLYLLKEKYGNTELDVKCKLEDVVKIIELSVDMTSMVRDLTLIRQCYKEGDPEAFSTLCDEFGIQLRFHDSYRKNIVDALIQKPELLPILQTQSAIYKNKNLDAFAGKPNGQLITLQSRHESEIKDKIQELIDQRENGRQHILDVTKIGDDLVLTAHFGDKTKVITTFSDEKSIESLVLTPAIRAQARYSSTEDKLYVKARSKVVKEYLLDGFGLVIHQDNKHFSDPDHQAYRLSQVMNRRAKFETPVPMELEESVLSAMIVEETLLVPLSDGREARVTIKVPDVESALQEISGGPIDLRTQERQSVTMELVLLLDNGKTKNEKITISNNTKINYNPKYKEVVTKCLQEWGLMNGAVRD